MQYYNRMLPFIKIRNVFGKLNTFKKLKINILSQLEGFSEPLAKELRKLLLLVTSWTHNVQKLPSKDEVGVSVASAVTFHSETISAYPTHKRAFHYKSLFCPTKLLWSAVFSMKVLSFRAPVKIKHVLWKLNPFRELSLNKSIFIFHQLNCFQTLWEKNKQANKQTKSFPSTEPNTKMLNVFCMT